MNKDFTTIDEQIRILKSRNLTFVSEETAAKVLQRFGYYNIINGYKDPYVENMNGEERYHDGITFEQVFSLFACDRAIRNRLMDAMLQIEDNLKTALAYTLGECFSADQSLYLKPENFRAGKNRNGIYQRDELLKKFDKIMHDDAQPIKHYREVHENIPPWILLKGASFGNLVNFIKLQKGPQKNKIISIVYNIPESFVAISTELKDLFMDTLFVCLDFRNRAAHGGRIYNYKTKSSFRFNPILHSRMNVSEADYRCGIGRTGLSALVQAISLFDNKEPSLALKIACSYFPNKHFELYPDDKTYLDTYLKI